MDGVDLLWLILAVAWMIFVVVAMIAFIPLVARPWVRAAFYGTPISMLSVIGMRMRGNPPTLLIDAYSALRRASINTSISDVESVYIDSRTRVKSATDLVALVKERSQDSGSKNA